MKLIKHISIIIAALLSCATVLSSCKKDKFQTIGGTVSFSADTLMFDTVFTQQGSATRSILIYNNEKQKIKLSSVRLAHGDSSFFRLNINGEPGNEIKDIDIAPGDSIHVFAAVTIDPTQENNPFLVEDNLIATLNNQEFSVPVVAFGQNVHYVVDSVLQTQTWTNDKPYVIVNNALVDSSATLQIEKGARVYMHANSRLYVLGSLKANGTKEDSIIFQGDRIDRKVFVGSYKDIPGEWGGLYFFSSSHDNEINYAIIKNGGLSTKLGQQSTIGATIQLDPDINPGGNPKLRLTNSVIKNSYQYGIIAFNSSLVMDNCLLVDCQHENLLLLQGGNYEITNSTIATYGAFSFFSRATGHVAAIIQNYYSISQTEYIGATLNLNMRNTIVSGSNNDGELYFDKKEDYAANVNLDHCLFSPVEGVPAFVNNQNNILNQNPLFRKVEEGDYHLASGSPAIGNGILIGTQTTDLDGVSRSNPPSIGCYEFIP